MRSHIEPRSPDSGAFLPPSLIQPHGVLLAIDSTGCIASLAGAVDSVFDRMPQELLGSPIATAFDPLAGPAPVGLRDLPEDPLYVGTWLAREHERWDVSAHSSGAYTLLELERASPHEPFAAETVSAIRSAFEAFVSCTDIQAVCVACAKAIGRLSGFDRVTVERLIADHAAVAAAVEEAADSSLPSPDGFLPWRSSTQAEALAHAVPDVNYLPVPVLPLPTVDGGPNTGRCILRGIGPAERGHFEDLGVAASLWLPIVVRGQRWGAVACHHSVPRPLPCALRMACELVVRECALRIEAYEVEAQLRQTATRLHAQREQATLLVQEAHHRVHNSLHIVGSMLQLQARQASQAGVRAGLEVAAGRLAAVGAVHRQLSRPEGANDVRLDEYLEQLCADLARSWGDAWIEQLTVDACDAALAADCAISLGLVVTELLINAAKYAYRGAPGQIRVRAWKHGSWLHVAVSDRGCGMHGEIVGTGLGSKLNRLFAAQLGGDIQLSSGDTGTTATVRVPLPRLRQEGAAGATVQAGAD